MALQPRTDRVSNHLAFFCCGLLTIQRPLPSASERPAGLPLGPAPRCSQAHLASARSQNHPLAAAPREVAPPKWRAEAATVRTRNVRCELSRQYWSRLQPGTGDLPLDHRSTRRTSMGRIKYRSRRHLQIYPSGRRLTSGTEPGAIATGSNTQLVWQHPLATARGSVSTAVYLFGSIRAHPR